MKTYIWQYAYENMFNIINQIYHPTMRSKPQWDITPHQWKWVLSKRQEIRKVGKDVGKGDLLPEGGNVNWFSHYGKQYEGIP